MVVALKEDKAQHSTFHQVEAFLSTLNKFRCTQDKDRFQLMQLHSLQLKQQLSRLVEEDHKVLEELLQMEQEDNQGQITVLGV